MRHPASAPLAPMARLVAAPLAAIALVLSLGLALPASADEPCPDCTPYLDAMTAVVHGASEKLVGLAEAIPADKYGWRPADGVRSVSESLVHVASVNFNLSRGLGIPFPEGFSRENIEARVTQKEEVVKLLKESFEHALQAMVKARTTDPTMEIDFSGNKMTAARVLTLIVIHGNEHLGQLIAYARMNGIVPPWSAGRPGGD